MHRLKWLVLHIVPHRYILGEMVLILCCFVIFASQALAVTRFLNRSLFVQDVTPGATTSYTITFGYNTLTSIGSLDLLFCYDPIPIDPCDAPTGLDVSHATLAAQSGETGFSILSESNNHIILTRNPSVVGPEPSTYTLSNIINPTDTTQSFSVRLSDYASTNATGPLIDLGSVVNEVTTGTTLETQVPPILDFCVGAQVNQNCNTQETFNYTDMGDLNPDNTLMATSQMAAGTNASNGYVITANGTTMAAGTHTIPALTSPTASLTGVNQFGINLVANTNPVLGQDPDGASTNAVVAPNYATPNKFMYQDGDVVASAPNVSLIRRFTVSYIVNSAADLRAGVYTTTITYICTGRF